MPRPALPPSSSVSANMTPMIDVVFQLIIFFMLVAQFSQQQSIKLELPSIDDRRTEPIVAESKTVVNVVPTGREAEFGGAYRLGLLSFSASDEGLANLSAALREMQSRQPLTEVFIRAQRTEPYARVHPAVQAVTAAGVRRVHLVTLPLTGNGAGGSEP